MDDKKLPDHFFVSVYETAKLIPFGRVTSYGAIAKYLGAPRSARIVGWAMNGCKKYDDSIPAHRVVNAKGVLSGKDFFDTENPMEALLLSEGIIVENGKIRDFENVFWNPEKELEI